MIHTTDIQSLSTHPFTQAWTRLAAMARRESGGSSPSTAAPSSSRWPAGAFWGALRLPELRVEVPSPSAPDQPIVGLLAARNLQCIMAASAGGARSMLAWSMGGVRMEACGHLLLEVVTEEDGTAAMCQGTAVAAAAAAAGAAAALTLDVSLPTVRLHMPLVEGDAERAVDAWNAALCAPTGLLLLDGQEQGACFLSRFPSGSIGAFLVKQQQQQQQQAPAQSQPLPPPPSYSCSSLRLHVRSASVSAALAGGRALQARATGLLFEATPCPTTTTAAAPACCSWTGEAAMMRLVLSHNSKELGVLPETAVQLKATSPPLLLPPSAAGGGSAWTAEMSVGTTGTGLRASMSSELADALAAAQQRLLTLARRVVGEQHLLTTDHPLLRARLATATREAQTHLAAARQAICMAMAAHGESKQRERARAMRMAAALAAKELQRRHLAAVHHSDHAGFMHVGALSSVSATAPTGHKLKAKALLALPRRWCVLRGDLLLVYDQPHSFHLERALALRDVAAAVAPVPVLREVALADAPTSKHHRRVYALVCTRGEAAAAAACAGQLVFLACEVGTEAAAWRVALQPFLHTGQEHHHHYRRQQQQQQQQQQPLALPSAAVAATPFPKRRFSLLASPRSASSGGGATATPSSSSSRHGWPPTSKPHSSVFTWRAKATAPGTPFTSEGPASSLLASTPASAVATAPPPPSCDKPSPAPPSFPSSVSVIPPPVTTASTATVASYVVTVLPWVLDPHEGSGGLAANSGLSSHATSPSSSAAPLSVTRSWTELLAFHHDYVPRWLQTTEERQLPRQGEHAPTGMGAEEAMAYADQLLRGSHALIQSPAHSEPERREQARVISLYMQLLLAACPSEEGVEKPAHGGCRAALQLFLGLSSRPTGMPSPSLSRAAAVEVEDPATAAAAAEAEPPLLSPVDEALRAADGRLLRAEAAVLRMQLTGALQAAACADRERAAAAATEALARRVHELEAALAEERARAATLEGECSRAVLARDDAVQAMTDVSTDSARKLMLGELRYLSLLKRALPSGYAAEQASHSLRHSHHHATKPTGPSPPPPALFSSSMRASPPPPPALNTTRRLSLGGLDDSSSSSSSSSSRAAATTALQRREQLEKLLRQPTPPPRSPRSVTLPPATAMGQTAADGDGVVTRAHHSEVVYRLKALLAAREEEARALGEALGLAQAEVEGRAYRAGAWRRLAQDGGDGDDGLFAPWRERVARERAGRVEAEARLVTSRAHWAGLVQGLSVPSEQRGGEGGGLEGDVEPGVAWVRARREYEEVLGLAQGFC